MDLTPILDLLGFSTGELERATLIFIRLSGLFLAAPFFSRSAGPMRIRMALLMMLTIVLFPLVPPWEGEGEGQLSAMFLAAIAELVLGAVVGMFAHWVFAAIQVAGSVMGFEMGLSMAQVLDPTSGAQQGVITTTLYWSALIIFLAIDGHHVLLAGLAGSFKAVPLGTVWDSGRLLDAGVLALTRLFKLSILIAAPVIITSKLLYLGMGLINRASPQVQVFFLAMPIAQMLGFIIIGLTLGAFGQIMVREIESFITLGLNLISS